MQSLVSILLRVVQLTQFAHSDEAGIVAAPLRDALAATLARLFPHQARSTFDELIAQVEPASPAALVEGLLEALEARLDDAPVNEARVATTIDTALTVALAARSPSVTQLAVELADPAIFTYLPVLTVESGLGQPLVVIVGAVPPSLGKLTISLPGRQRQLRRTTLTYLHGVDQPLLNLSFPSATVDSRVEYNRANWRQREHPDARLDLFTHELRPCGQVYTSRLALPFAIEGARVSITLPAAAAAALVTTQILDASGRELARIGKVVAHDMDQGRAA